MVFIKPIKFNLSSAKLFKYANELSLNPIMWKFLQWTFLQSILNSESNLAYENQYLQKMRFLSFFPSRT